MPITMNVYFDNAATTWVRSEVIDAMTAIMHMEYGNPSSPHYMGRNAAKALAAARKSIADVFSAKANEIFFTSGGTEADNWAIMGCAEMLARGSSKHIITSTIEHDAVLEPIKKLEKNGWEVTYLSPNMDGVILAESFADALREDTAFASIMFVNNETGAINPIETYGKEIKKRKLSTVLHVDAVQAYGKIAFRAGSLGADLISISAHKIHGPKGIGALYIKGGNKAGIKLPPLILGGGQESGFRAGTEALPAIVGFAKAASLCSTEQVENTLVVEKLRKYITSQLEETFPDIFVIGNDTSPYILSISLPGYKSEVLMSFLEGEGICVARSAACKKGARSRVLEMMGLSNEIIDAALRVSFSPYNTQDEAEYFIEMLKKALATLRK
ncbi:MAG: cysteine desulfurase [Oscillospiraceae bacterium]|nr:cysteine desulfurase [Oscillospiraceae bacterium]